MNTQSFLGFYELGKTVVNKAGLVFFELLKPIQPAMMLVSEPVVEIQLLPSTNTVLIIRNQIKL